jgi:hypothetical protein
MDGTLYICYTIGAQSQRSNSFVFSTTMNKKIIWTIVILVIVAGIYYAMTYRPTTPTQVIETPVVSEQQPASAGPVLKIGKTTAHTQYRVLIPSAMI